MEYIHFCILNRITYFNLYLLESCSLNYLPAWLAIRPLLPLWINLVSKGSGHASSSSSVGNDAMMNFVLILETS